MFRKLFFLLTLLPFYAYNATEPTLHALYTHPVCYAPPPQDTYVFTQPQPSRCWNTNLSVGSHFNYTCVDFDGPEAIDGYMAGVSVYSQTRVKCVDLHLNFEGSWDTNYLRGDPCQKSSVAEYLLELKVMPCNFQFCHCLNAGIYTGFGWNQFTNNQLPGLASLCYRYNKLFVPLGFHFQCALKGIDLAVEFEWRPDVYSCLSVDGTGLDNSCEHAFRLQVPVNIYPLQTCRNFLITLSPFFDWSKYGRAQERNSLDVDIDIPSTTRWSLGLRTLIQLRF